MRNHLTLASVFLLCSVVAACETTPPTADPLPGSTELPASTEGIAPPAGAQATAMPLVPFAITGAPGGIASVDVTFVVDKLAADYAVLVHVGNETVLTESNVIPQPGTSRWSGRTVLTVPVRLPTTPGTYEIRTGLYSGDDRLILVGGTSLVTDDDASVRYTVGSVTVSSKISSPGGAQNP